MRAPFVAFPALPPMSRGMLSTTIESNFGQELAKP